MVHSRPLFATAADRALYVERNAHAVALRSLLASRNVLVVGERGSGKTSLLYALAADLIREGRTAWVAPLLVADTLDEAVAIIYRSAAEAGVLSDPDLALAEATARGQDPFGPLELVRRLGQQTPEAVVLVDDATAAIGHSLFGRLRDELWQLPLTWCATTNADEAHGLRTPPADAFFDITASLELDEDDQGELLVRRFEGAERQRAAGVLIDGPRTPRELILRANRLVEQGGDVDPQRLLRAIDARRARAEAAAGRAGAMLVAELETLGPVSASDEQLLRRVGWTRPRTADVLNKLVEAEVVRAREAASSGRPGRPRKIYELRAPEEFLPA